MNVLQEPEMQHSAGARNSIFLESIKNRRWWENSAFIMNYADPSLVLLRRSEHDLHLSTRKTIAKIKSFLRLQENWDSYDASIVQEATVREAVSFVEQIDEDGLEVFFTAPGRDGEILVELKSGDKEAEVYFYADSRSMVSFSTKDELAWEGELDENYAKLIEQFKNDE